MTEVTVEDNMKTVSLRCDCHSENAVFSRSDWKIADHRVYDYELCIEDSYCGGGYSGIKGRFKRAWYAFWEKPLSYNGVYCKDPKRMQQFLLDCLALVEEDINSNGNH